MRRIFIDDRIKQLAADYATHVKALNRLAKLGELRNALNADELAGYRNYVDSIIQNYDELLTVFPVRTSVLVPQVPHNFDFSKKIQPTGKKEKKFYEHVVDAMGYNKIRNELYPVYAREMGIKACVYCNAQYGVSIRRNRTDFTSSFQIDHFMPKSEYPCFSTSFYNLQPVCGHCNQLKRDRDACFNLFTSYNQEIEPFDFTLDRRSVLRFLATNDESALDIELHSKDVNLLRNHLELFHINEKYQNHKDEVAKLILKSRFYSNSYMEQLRNCYNNIFSRAAYTFDEVLLGFPIKSCEIHQRPLTKLLQNIASDFGLIK